MTAAATTGPNSEPRPTSSTPATKCAPSCHTFFSNLRVQWSLFNRRSLAAEAESRFPGADLSFEDTEANKSIFAHYMRVAQCGKTAGETALSSGAVERRKEYSPGRQPRVEDGNTAKLRRSERNVVSGLLTACSLWLMHPVTIRARCLTRLAAFKDDARLVVCGLTPIVGRSTRAGRPRQTIPRK